MHLLASVLARPRNMKLGPGNVSVPSCRNGVAGWSLRDDIACFVVGLKVGLDDLSGEPGLLREIGFHTRSHHAPALTTECHSIGIPGRSWKTVFLNLWSRHWHMRIQLNLSHSLAHRFVLFIVFVFERLATSWSTILKPCIILQQKECKKCGRE